MAEAYYILLIYYNYTFTDMGAVFQTMAPFLREYADYINKYEDAASTLTMLRQIPAFEGLYLQLQHDPTSRGMDLMSYLIQPVQRVPRYILLIKEVSQNRILQRY